MIAMPCIVPGQLEFHGRTTCHAGDALFTRRWLGSVAPKPNVRFALHHPAGFHDVSSHLPVSETITDLALVTLEITIGEQVFGSQSRQFSSFWFSASTFTTASTLTLTVLSCTVSAALCHRRRACPRHVFRFARACIRSRFHCERIDICRHCDLDIGDKRTISVLEELLCTDQQPSFSVRRNERAVRSEDLGTSWQPFNQELGPQLRNIWICN